MLIGKNKQYLNNACFFFFTKYTVEKFLVFSYSFFTTQKKMLIFFKEKKTKKKDTEESVIQDRDLKIFLHSINEKINTHKRRKQKII